MQSAIAHKELKVPEAEYVNDSDWALTKSELESNRRRRNIIFGNGNQHKVSTP